MSEAAASGRRAPALMLLHGFGGLGAVWEPVAARLPAGVAVLAPDLPGHGAAEPWDGRAPAKAFAQAALTALDRHGVPAAHWAGHSLGGAAAILAALLAPQRVLSLTILAPGGIGEEIASERLRAWAAARTTAEIETAFAGMAGTEATLSRDVLAALTRDRRRPGRRERLLAMADALSAGDRQGAFPPDQLAAIERPIQVLWGTADPLLPFGQTARLPAAWDVHPLEGCGHMLIDEAPEQVAALLTTRLA